MRKDFLETKDCDPYWDILLIKSAVESDSNLLDKILDKGGNVNFQTPNGLI